MNTNIENPTGKKYTVELHTRILIRLLKEHGIRKIVASPGSTNITFIGSLQNDPFFEIYSVIDERSAAYVALGIARESGEAVAISCTGATASRNYLSALTEAYYSKVPILAITSTQSFCRKGHYIPQVIDRSQSMNDVAVKKIQIREIVSEEDLWATEVAINDALLALRRHGAGPVHIDLVTTYSSDFSANELPNAKVIHRYSTNDILPSLDNKKVLILVGAHTRWTKELTTAVDEFCEKYGACVVCEHISNYRGRYGVYPSLLVKQADKRCTILDADILLHIGTVDGYGAGSAVVAKEVWRINPDGEIRDTFKRLTCVFEMEEIDFFYLFCLAKKTNDKNTRQYETIKSMCDSLQEKIPELPLSNIWVAQHSIPLLPNKCEVHLAILNTLRAWGLLQIDHNKGIEFYSNTGGFGIDGLLSTLVGSSLCDEKKLYFGIVGDLAFFYDMNALGIRHIGNNIRIMVINNGRGTEFQNYDNMPGASFGKAADYYISAAGHYGQQSTKLVKHFAEDLGFTYISTNNKEEFLKNASLFFVPELTEKPILFEVFTETKDESEALYNMYHIESSIVGETKKIIRSLIGENGVRKMKKVLKR